MKKLEPGMLCRVVEYGAGIDGMIVKVMRYSEKGDSASGLTVRPEAVLTDGNIPYPSGKYPPDGWIRDSYLQPINPDHQPADEEWQADFKRLLCGDKQTVNSGG